jgi:ABC-type proline/glycine betaine transport system permease subunit
MVATVVAAIVATVVAAIVTAVRCTTQGRDQAPRRVGVAVPAVGAGRASRCHAFRASKLAADSCQPLLVRDSDGRHS